MTGTPAIEATEVELELKRVLASSIFQRAQRSQRLLRYLVEFSVFHPDASVKEYTIALEVFDRTPNYNPSVDATVRVEVSRLRQRLREYYEDEGRYDGVWISVPKGSYRAIIELRAPVSRDGSGILEYEPSARAEKQVAVIQSTAATSLEEVSVRSASRLDGVRSLTRWRVVVFATTLLLLGASTVAIWFMMRTHSFAPNKLTELKLVSSFGVHPALSRDGKEIAFMSSVGGGTPHIWVQQTAGGTAIQLSAGTAADFAPDISPDGTQIAFASARKGGGIYIMPTLPGESRLVIHAAGADEPRFSPDGKRILYKQNSQAFVVSSEGGNAFPLPWNQDFLLEGSPFWAPTGHQILFYGSRKSDLKQSHGWWIAPLAGGEPRQLLLSGASDNSSPESAVRGWRSSGHDRTEILYSTSNDEGWRLWGVELSPDGTPVSPPRLHTSGSGRLGAGGSISENARFAFNIWSSSGSIYQVPLGRGTVFQLPLMEGANNFSPSVSRDGKSLAYSMFTIGKPVAILLRDLDAGIDHVLDDRHSEDNSFTSISPDGASVIFEKDCRNVQSLWFGGPMPCSFIADRAGSPPVQVCERCMARGFFSDGRRVLIQKYHPEDVNKTHIAVLDLYKHTEADLLSLTDRPVVHPFLSWDDQWIVFRVLQPGGASPSQIMIAALRHGKVAQQAEWIPVTDGQHSDDKPQFSADGKLIYFTSTRDGNLCVWAQPLNPVTKRPQGPPFAVQHFHNSEGRAGASQISRSDLTVARDKLFVNLPKMNSETWVTTLP